MTILRKDLDKLDLSDCTGERLPPVHPGELLQEEWLTPMGLSARALAQKLDVSNTRVSAILAGERSITADTAIKLGKFLGTTPEFWLRLQNAYDLDVAMDQMNLAPRAA